MEFKHNLPYSTAVALDYSLCCLLGWNQRGQRDDLILSLHFTGLSDINTDLIYLQIHVARFAAQVTFTWRRDVRGGRESCLHAC